MKRRPFGSLSSRLILTHMTIAVSVLVMLGMIVLAALLPLRREQTYRRLADTLLPGILLARLTESSFLDREEPVGRPARPRALSLLRDQALAQGVRLLIVEAPQRRIIFDTLGPLQNARWDRPLVGDGEPPLLLIAFLDGDRPSTGGTRGSILLPDGLWLYLATPIAGIEPGDATPAALYLISMTPRPTLIRSVRPSIGLVFALLAMLLILVYLLSLWITRTVTRNLAPVVEGTKAIAEGNLDYRISTTSSLVEVATLADSFNRMADEVQRSRQAQRDFVANVGHDLKTPLTSIQGFALALQDGTATGPAAARAIRIINSEAQRLAHLVEELLELVRLDRGRLQLQRNPFDLAAELRQIADVYGDRAAQSDIHLRFDDPGAPLTIHADRDRLRRVVTNLLDNALAHTPPGGTITLTAASLPLENGTREIEIAVSDTGKGIPVADLPHLFDRFYQVDKARSGKRGSGLGLAIVKEIVEQHGGRVGVESVPGVGSRFWLRLPQA